MGPPDRYQSLAPIDAGPLCPQFWGSGEAIICVTSGGQGCDQSGSGERALRSLQGYSDPQRTNSTGLK